MAGPEEPEGYESARLIKGLGFNDDPVYGPDRSRDKKGIDREGAENIDVRLHISVVISADPDTRYLPEVAGAGLIGRVTDGNTSQERSKKYWHEPKSVRF